MAHPLDIGSTSPPAPGQDGGPPRVNALGNALQGPQNALYQQPRSAPAPSHLQTTAALRHFGAVMGELKTLMKNPDLGRSNVKDAIIDGTMKLVAERMISAAQAVVQLAAVPDDPLQQRKWVKQMVAQTVQASNNVIDHHAAAQPGTLDHGFESQAQQPDPDQHQAIMTGLMQHYKNAGFQ